MKAKRPTKLKRARTERAKPRSVQRACSNAGWIYQAIWTGGIEYEMATIASPAKVAMMAARAMADGCQQITIEKQKHLNAPHEARRANGVNREAD